MNRSASFAVALVATALFGCQGGVPESAVKAIPPDGFAMGATPATDIRVYDVDTTHVFRNTVENCDVHVYFAEGGVQRGESYCSGKRYTSTGQWTIADDGTHCSDWDNPDWKGGCVNWVHQGDDFFTWEKKSGDFEQLKGETQVYQGNIFNL